MVGGVIGLDVILKLSHYLTMSAQDGTSFCRGAEQKSNLIPHCCFLKMDASEDNPLYKETDQLLPLHVPWHHNSMKNR